MGRHGQRGCCTPVQPCVQWLVLASGGRHLVNPACFDVPDWQAIESPLVVTGRRGNEPTDLKAITGLVHPWAGGQVVMLVGESGTEIAVKSWYRDTGEGQIHATYTGDASEVPANGTWRLWVTDHTCGIFTAEPGYLDCWSLSF
ncbi:proprotein convertase P-domain-containing protein [Streptomyces sp. NPDC002265]|uniref:proprotein convertase P-domain-containing protein n=1 Tax=Streptomyces sp. NPDC002265 TaxID=3154415 RepID=UPI003325AB7E